jgi:hypothetical protein
MPLKFRTGDKVRVPQGTPGSQAWWWGKEATVSAILEDGALYQVLFDDAQDWAFIEEDMLARVMPSNGHALASADVRSPEEYLGRSKFRDVSSD